ncbi:MAG: hypothetical protein HN360_09515, partial [Rhodospirillaceae bacterium]|nr:hypothetical protein [Rhodospirillaceae bacterium]
MLEGDVDKTSNTIVRGALDSIKYPAEKALPKGEKMDDVPGFEDDHKELVEEIKVIKADREADREAARNSRSPLEGEIGGTPAETPTKPTPDSGDEQSGVTPDATNTPGAK